jgi:hypothetical protein
MKQTFPKEKEHITTFMSHFFFLGSYCKAISYSVYSHISLIMMFRIFMLIIKQKTLKIIHFRNNKYISILFLKKFIAKFSPLEHLNKVLGFSSLQLLAFVYCGSVMAAIYQLKYGTKYKRFPKYLDFWLKTRKQAIYFKKFILN